MDECCSLILKYLIITRDLDSWKLLSCHVKKGRSHNYLNRELDLKESDGEDSHENTLKCIQLPSDNTVAAYCHVPF